MYHTRQRYGQTDRYYMKAIVEQRAQIPINRDLFEIQHGLYDHAIATDIHELNHLFFAWNNKIKEEWKELSDVPAYVFGAPYVHYRRAKNIQKDPNAKGTVVFPSHGLEAMPAQYNIDAYCQQLLQLPKKFHPITICVFWGDISQFALHLEYLARGFHVTSVFLEGINYVDGFYNILKKHEYATSNIFGSYVLYAIEMDIPFFLLGERVVYDNRKQLDPNMEKTLFVADSDEMGKFRTKLFRNAPKDIITSEQRDYIHSEIGMHECLSQEQLRDAVQPILRDPKSIDHTDLLEVKYMNDMRREYKKSLQFLP